MCVCLQPPLSLSSQNIINVVNISDANVRKPRKKNMPLAYCGFIFTIIYEVPVWGG